VYGREGRAFRIFISYRRSDSGPYARNLYDSLSQRFGPTNVFYDLDSIAPGRDFVAVLDETLRSADVVLVVIGPAWLEVRDDKGRRRLDDPDDYVRVEVEAALRAPDLRVIPVLVSDAKMPGPRSLPDALAQLTRRNAICLSDEHWRATINELVSVLGTAYDEVMADEPPAARSGSDAERSERVLGRRRETGLGSTSRSSLIGRAEVLARLMTELSRPGLVTITGPGGIGKTRLLREAHVRLRDRFPKTYVVELADVRGAVGAQAALADALVPDHRVGTHLDDASTADNWIARLPPRASSRRSLLLIDNCEHLLDDLPRIVSSLLDACAQLSVVATSREPLGCAGERVIPVAPLECPGAGESHSAERLADVAAVRLLVERARDAGADVHVSQETAPAIGSICRQLDGIPLALELAAPLLTALSPDDLAARLSGQVPFLTNRNDDARHRTLHQTIDWSYQLLDDVQRTLLRRLGVFVGGFDLAAAEDVCADESDPALVESLVSLALAELVSKSLVMFDRERSRYRLLEPIRLFAREQLKVSGGLEAISREHARWALRRSRETLVEELSGKLAAGYRFDSELDNVHAALDWLQEHDQKAYMAMVAALGYTWMRTDWRRGHAAADLALGMLDAASPRLRASVLLSRGMVEERGTPTKSLSWLEEARTLFADTGDELGVAFATFFLGRALELTNSPGAALARFSEAVERFQQLHLHIGEAWALLNMGVVAGEHGAHDESRLYHERAYAIALELNATALLGTARAALGYNSLMRGDVETARADLRFAIQLQDEVNDPWNFAGMLAQSALAELACDDLEAAESVLRRALKLCLDLDTDAWSLREILLVFAVLRMKQGNERAARYVIAETVWNGAAPFWVDREYEPIQQALRALEPLVEVGGVPAPGPGTDVDRMFELARLIVSEREDPAVTPPWP
jgi:non-specific serine/threonine protein kinase